MSLLQGGPGSSRLQGCAHAGYVRAARWLLGQVEPLLAQVLAAPEHQGYALAFCGHSLGAAVAALAALMYVVLHLRHLLSPESLGRCKRLSFA